MEGLPIADRPRRPPWMKPRAPFVVVLVLAFSVGGIADEAAAAKPRLRVASAPFSVLGTGFKPGEAVRVSVHAADRDAVKTVVASASGDFAVAFARLKLGECPDYIVSARGSKGSRATRRSVPRPCGADPGPSR
jgi:hypothetical protein